MMQRVGTRRKRGPKRREEDMMRQRAVESLGGFLVMEGEGAAGRFVMAGCDVSCSDLGEGEAGGEAALDVLGMMG
jgi:hypothetical protein